MLGNLPEAGAACSADVVDLNSGQRIFEANADTAMVPASNAKVFTLAAAIDGLGANFQFRTVLATRGPDLIVVGDGDPSLGDPELSENEGRPITAVFDEWAGQLKRKGPSVIQGDLVIDESIFDDQRLHPDWDKADIKSYFAPPVGALNFHDNCVEITIWPDKENGKPVHWSVNPSTSLIEMTNRCKSRGGNRPTIDRPQPTFDFVISGTCSQRSTFERIPGPDPGLFFADALRSRLAEQGVTLQGKIRRQRVRDDGGKLPGDCERVAVHVTPLAQVTARVGKDSHNLSAECLLKRLGYEFAKARGDAKPVGSWETGRAAVQAFLTRAGVEAGRVVVSDASGLSRSNRASASDFTRVLAFMRRHREWELFSRSLSVAGRDGSLKKRMTDVPGKVFAKTGYVSGVRTLSGYVEAPDRRLYCFSVLFNNVKKTTRPFNKVHDNVCRILATGQPEAKNAAGDK